MRITKNVFFRGSQKPKAIYFVIDLNGKIILNKKPLSKSIEIDLHSLKTGVYAAHIKSINGNYSVHKLIKQ